MGIDYCSCKDCGEKEKRSEFHIGGQKFNYSYNFNDLKHSPIVPNINNISCTDNSFGTDQDISNKSLDVLKNINQPEKFTQKINVENYTISRNNETKMISSPLSLIKEKDQEEEASEIESMKKNIIRYNNNDYSYNKILINNNNSNINIYEDNSYNIQYINQNENDPKLFNSKIKISPSKKPKNIIYRNDLKKDNKKQLIYEKKINMLNENFNKNNYFNNDNDYNIENEYKVPMMYKKVSVSTPKIFVKNQQNHKKSKIVYDLNI